MALTRLLRLGIAAGIGAISVGCSDTFAPPEDFGLAAATTNCGPGDGPTVDVYLASGIISSLPPDPPYVRIFLRRWVDELEGESWSLAGDGANGMARHYSTVADFELATSGGVAIDDVDDENNIEGMVDLIFPNAGRIRGDFLARWVQNDDLCI